MMKTKDNKYTCTEYREEMMLLSLNRRLNNEELSDSERQEITAEIKKLKSAMDMD